MNEIIRLVRLIFLLHCFRLTKNISQDISHNFKISCFVKFLIRSCEYLFFPFILFSKNFWQIGYKPWSIRFSSFLQHAGPIYIKFGQALSTRDDLVGKTLAAHLRYLQDKLPPFSSDIARTILAKSLGEKIENIFSFFDDSPLSSASISQVHKAILLENNQYVAVKILRPNIQDLYEKDIKLLYFLAKIFQFSPLKKQTARLKLNEVVRLFENTMKQELDLKIEAAHIEEMRENFANDTKLHLPYVYIKFCRENCLITEFIDGISIYDKEALIKAGLCLKEISKNLAIIFLNQVYRDGFFHADLHPGNIFIKKNGTIVLVDFGIMGRLEEREKLLMAEILFALAKGDYKLVAKLHLKAGYIPADTNLFYFAYCCRQVAKPIIEETDGTKISIGNLLLQLFKITEDFGMEIQPRLILLQKNLILAEGLGKILNPSDNLWKLAEPWVRDWAKKNISPEAKIFRYIKSVINQILYSDL